MEFLEPIESYLTQNFGELGPLYAVGMLGVLCIVVTLPLFLRKTADPLDKLKGNHAPRQQSASPVEIPQAKLRHGNKNADKLDKFANFLEPQDEEELSAARLKLLRAGYRSKSAVRAFHFAQLVLGLGFLFLGVMYAVVSSATSEEISTQQLMLSVLLPGGIGYFLPKYWVERRVQSRQERSSTASPTVSTCCWSASRPASRWTRPSSACRRKSAPATRPCPKSSRLSATR